MLGQAAGVVDGFSRRAFRLWASAECALERRVRYKCTLASVGLVDPLKSLGAVALFVQGKPQGTLAPGRYAFWKNVAAIKVAAHDTREAVLDVPGQEILTADKVSLRLNALATYRVREVMTAAMAVDDPKQALYRETQLALRAAVGGRELDALLADKEALCRELEERMRPRAGALGLELIAVGIRDLILPGDMKELFNKVMEARKAAEANLIARREEAAALRHQANSAKTLADNPTLLRLRELETLEKVAAHAKLNVVLGDKGLAERIVNLI